MGISNGGSLVLGDSYLTSGLWGITHLRMTPTYYSASGVITPQAQTAVITKATAALMTLAAPTISQNGDLLIITSQTAAAHTVTANALLADAVTGSPHGTATFAAFIGASLVLMADNLLWNVIASTGVTIL